MKFNWIQNIMFLSCFFFSVFTFLFIIKTHFSIISIFLLLFIFVMYFFSYLLWKTNPSHINDQEIDIKKEEDFYITVTYKQYQFRSNINNKNRRNIVPKIDNNGNKIHWITRVVLNNYIYVQYDTLSVPNGYYVIEARDVKKYFPNMTICSEDAKEKFINRKHFYVIYFFVFGLIILNGDHLIEDITRREISSKTLLLFIFIIGFVLFSFIMNIKRKNHERNAEIYSCKANVYDKKKIEDREGVNSYYIRVWNQDKQVLKNWFLVNRSFYENGKTGTLYLIVLGDHYSVDFEKGED